VAVGLDGDFLPKDKFRRGLFRPTFARRVNAGRDSHCVWYNHKGAGHASQTGQEIVPMLEDGFAYLGGTEAFVARTVNGTDTELVGHA
jgi:hypothetical protein